MIKKYLFITTILLNLTLNLNAQKDTKRPMGMIYMVDGDSILLRWAPMNYAQWKTMNTKGICLQRYIIDKQQKAPLLEGSDTIRILPYEKWQPIVDTSDQAAIVAQAIFGETFSINSAKTSIFQLIDLAREQENRYTFSMLMACQDFNLARYMALGAIQKINAAKMYYYKVFILSENAGNRTDTAYLFVDVKMNSKLPEVQEFYCHYKNNQVRITWPKLVNEDFYNNYEIERSKDSINFIKLTKNIFVNPDITGRDPDYTYIDTLSVANSKYYYRIRGINSFGRYSPYSKIRTVRAYSPLTEKPEIDTMYFDNKNLLNIKWSFPQSLDTINKGFHVLISKNINSDYELVTKDLLPPDTRVIQIKHFKPVNYIIVAAYDHGNNAIFSLPKMIQRTDSIPPIVPSGLTGKSLKNGVVDITWNKNQEDDITGYRVFYSTEINKEYTQITRELLTDNKFSYKFPLNWLNHQVFIKVLAEDVFFNYSSLTEPIAVTLPDTIKPSSAIIYNYKTGDDGNSIEWNNSSSNDLKENYLLRANSEGTDTLLNFRGDNIKKFIDKDIHAEGKYIYYIVSVDSSLNKAYSNKVSLRFKNTTEQIKLKANPDIENKTIQLNWTINPDLISKIIIYRSQSQEKLRLYETIDTPSTYYIDTDILLNQPYNYRLKFFYKSGKMVFSNAVTSKL